MQSRYCIAGHLFMHSMMACLDLQCGMMFSSVQLHQQLEDLNKRMEEIARDHGNPRPAVQASDASRQKVLIPS